MHTKVLLLSGILCLLDSFATAQNTLQAVEPPQGSGQPARIGRPNFGPKWGFAMREKKVITPRDVDEVEDDIDENSYAEDFDAGLVRRGDDGAEPPADLELDQDERNDFFNSIYAAATMTSTGVLEDDDAAGTDASSAATATAMALPKPVMRRDAMPEAVADAEAEADARLKKSMMKGDYKVVK